MYGLISYIINVAAVPPRFKGYPRYILCSTKSFNIIRHANGTRDKRYGGASCYRSRRSECSDGTNFKYKPCALSERSYLSMRIQFTVERCGVLCNNGDSCNQFVVKTVGVIKASSPNRPSVLCKSCCGFSHITKLYRDERRNWVAQIDALSLSLSY